MAIKDFFNAKYMRVLTSKYTNIHLLWFTNCKKDFDKTCISRYIWHHFKYKRNRKCRKRVYNGEILRVRDDVCNFTNIATQIVKTVWYRCDTADLSTVNTSRIIRQNLVVKASYVIYIYVYSDVCCILSLLNIGMLQVSFWPWVLPMRNDVTL